MMAGPSTRPIVTDISVYADACLQYHQNSDITGYRNVLSIINATTCVDRL